MENKLNSIELIPKIKKMLDGLYERDDQSIISLLECFSLLETNSTLARRNIKKLYKDTKKRKSVFNKIEIADIYEAIKYNCFIFSYNCFPGWDDSNGCFKSTGEYESRGNALYETKNYSGTIRCECGQVGRLGIKQSSYRYTYNILF